VWRLRFPDQHGQWFTRRATTNQILHGMHEGIWPTGAEAARGTHRTFRPLAIYPEFRVSIHSGAMPTALRGHEAATSSRKATQTPSGSCRNWQVLLSTGFGVGLLAAAALCRLLLTQ
jgi:hypothetical protein